MTEPVTDAPKDEGEGFTLSWIGNFFRGIFWPKEKPAPAAAPATGLPSGEVKKGKKGKKGKVAPASTVAPAPAADPAPAGGAK